METCVLIPRELSIILQPTGRPGRLLEMGATLWSNCLLVPGCTFTPDEGELRLDRIELYTDLSDKDVRRRYGCFDEVLEVDKREVRHCNWVRFLRATSNMSDVNVVARRVKRRPLFQVVKEIPPNGELKAFFEELIHPTTGILDTLTVPLTFNATNTNISSPVAASLVTSSTPPSVVKKVDFTVPPFIPAASRHSNVTPPNSRPEVATFRPLPEAEEDVSPTDLSIRRVERSTVTATTDVTSFTSPSSGFDSPSMHCSRPGVDGTTEAGGDKFRLFSSAASPTTSGPVQPTSHNEHDEYEPDSDVDPMGEDSDALSVATSSGAGRNTQSPWSLHEDDALADDEHDSKTASLTSLPVPVVRRKEKTWLPCSYCNKKFDRPSLLKRHMRTHTGEKPHACDVCFKAFSTSSSLNTHRRIHSGEKPHECPVCGKRFTASSNLYYHRMTHKKEKPHKCSLCSKSFPTPGDLKSHMYVHSGSWPYKCDMCNRGFSKQANLKNHMLLHTGDKPHHCDLCGKKFALLCNLKTHLKMHEEEPHESCVSCGQSYLVGRMSPSSSSAGRCPDCIAQRHTSTTADQAVTSSTTRDFISGSGFSIDSIVGNARRLPVVDTGSDVKRSTSKSRAGQNQRQNPPTQNVTAVQSRFAALPVAAAAHAQYYAAQLAAASGLLPTLNYRGQFPVPVQWPTNNAVAHSQRYGVL